MPEEDFVMTKFLICTVLILTSVAKAASTGESCPACSSSNTFSHLNFFNEDASVKSPNGFMLGSGFKVNLKCAYACEQQPSVKEVTATSTFLPLRQKLIVGDGGVNPKQSLFMYGSMTARLSAWTGEVCMAAAEAACGGALQVATSEAKQARIGSQIFALPLGVRARHETVISPFVIGQGTLPVDGDSNFVQQKSQIADAADQAAETAMQDKDFGSLEKPEEQVRCHSKIPVTTAYGDCWLEDGTRPLCPAKPMGVVDKKEAFCADALENELKLEGLQSASISALTTACESYFSRLAAGRRFLGSSCAAFRGDTQCSAWAVDFTAADAKP
jgi:hypothetical protein